MNPIDNKVRLLLTGAGGFVGYYLLEALKNHFDLNQIFVWYHNHNIDYHDINISKVDITNKKDVFTSIEQIKPTHVVHLAAISHIPTSFSNPELTWKVNLFGTLYILEALNAYAPNSIMINVGSSDIYGDSFNEEDIIDENTLFKPLNPYASSKAAADLLVGQYGYTSTIKTIRLRPFNHVGPRQSDNFVTSVFASQIAKIERGLQEPILKVGNLTVKKDFLDVRDVVDAYVKVILNAKSLNDGSIFNIARGNPISIQSILDDLLSMSSMPIKVQLDKARFRKTDIPIVSGSYEKIFQALGWKPQISWEQTLRDIMNYWRNHIK